MAEYRATEDRFRVTATKFRAQSQSLSIRVEAVDGMQDALTQSWTGEAADGYSRYQDGWSESARDLASSLSSIGGALDTMADNLRATETAAAGVWPV